MVTHKQKKILLSVLIVAVTFGIAFADRIYYTHDSSGNRVAASIHAPGTRGISDLGPDTDDTLSQSRISIYPNPTAGPLTVELSGYNIENAGIIVTEMSGKNIIHLTEITETNELNLAEYPSGIYLLRIRIGENESVYKIVKQ